MHGNATSLDGKRCGKLVATDIIRRHKAVIRHLCHCDCGNHVWMATGHFISGRKTSCGRDRKTPLERFLAKVKKTSTCWLWTGSLNIHGYGQFYAYGKDISAHRFAYETYVAAIPPNKDIDHLCRNRRCVNPGHLEAVTRQINLLRGDTIVARESRQTHCIHSHVFDEKNTYIDRRGRRHCRKCRVNRQRTYRKNK